MTAINAFIQNGAAYLLTDGAVTDSNGVLLAIHSKVTVLNRFRAAIALTGMGPIATLDQSEGRLTDAIKATRPGNQAELMAALPAIVARMHGENAAAIDTEHNVGVALYVALWSKKAREAQLWTIQSDDALLGPSYRPCTCARLRRFICTPPGMIEGEFMAPIFDRPVDLEDRRSFNPVTDGVKLVGAQRNIRDGIGPWGGHSVGGMVELTVVSAAGIRKRVLATWPDRVGEKIVP